MFLIPELESNVVPCLDGGSVGRFVWSFDQKQAYEQQIFQVVVFKEWETYNLFPSDNRGFSKRDPP
jgi:hypothetical protein